MFKEIRESIDMHFLFLPEVINIQKKLRFFPNQRIFVEQETWVLDKN